jgi:hypothetical protein
MRSTLDERQAAEPVSAGVSVAGGEMNPATLVTHHRFQFRISMGT